MTDQRPNPDALLSQIKGHDASRRRGLLKIYFGYAAGVGKTYTMLEDARRVAAAGKDVVVGYVEPHARPETEALLDGLEQLETTKSLHRGVELQEFDVDRALRRSPELILVDELAHSNVEGSRHAKRWQDVDELLDAGMDVWTTLNVQHIESLNDIIGQVTGIAVRETIPDQIFEAADELELIDIPPEELLHRLQAGKIYIPAQAARALQHFFQKSNLNALRELSLRQAASRVHTEVESARRVRSASQPWATAERLLVCIGPSPTTARVLRTAKRMAAALDAPWIAVSVDSQGQHLSDRSKSQLAEHFRLAERLGAETVTLTGQAVAETILRHARDRNVTKILIGKTNQPRWRRFLFGTVVDDILDRSGPIDVYVIHGERVEGAPKESIRRTKQTDWVALLKATGIIACGGIVAALLRQLQWAQSEANTVMIFLAAVGIVAHRYGRGVSIFASVLAVVLFDVFFVLPFFTIAIADAQYLVTFAVMLALALVISSLTSQLKSQVESSQNRETQSRSLSELGKQLSSVYGEAFLVAAAARKLSDLTQGVIAIYTVDHDMVVHCVFGQDNEIGRQLVSLSAAEWVIKHDQLAGAGTNTLPNVPALFLPIAGSQQILGAMAISTRDNQRLLEPEQRRLLESCANQLALALERDRLAVDAAEARIAAETEQVRSTLLSSVSHDLKTPLAAIAGATSSLLETPSLSAEINRQLLETILDESTRLNRLLENILQMSRLDAGAIAPNYQWHVIEEIVGSALNRTKSELSKHPVDVQIPADLPLVSVDGLLLEQMLVNLLENAARYTSPGTAIVLTAEVDCVWLKIQLKDKGPGLPLGAEDRVFDKFYRGTSTADGGRGSGLGLAICRAIAKAHGGSIQARNAKEGGAEFVIRLPMGVNAPKVMLDEPTA